MTLIKILSFYTFFNVVYSQYLHSQSYQPRIVAQDGHLLFYSAENKNISFIAPGKGVHVNGIDILQSTKISNNALQEFKTYQTNFASSFTKISKLEHLIDEGGLLLKVNKIGYSNSTNIAVGSLSVERRIILLTRKVNGLQKTIRTLTSLLTVDECSSNPCKNGATCLDSFNSFACQCPPQWEGANCDKDVDECARFAGTDLGCQNGATCTNTPGSYECKCPRGWFGVHCTARANDCKLGSSAELCGHGTCVAQFNEVGYKCICDQGWTTDGTNPICNTDVNECTMNEPPCSVNPPVPCINLPGTFNCGSCPQGYSGNGYHCIDVDECTTSNGGCSTNPMVQCINTLGSRMCGSCPSGYTGDGKICSYSGVCGVNNGNCHPLATCKSNTRISATSVECICPSGYAGDGIGPAGCTQTNIPSVNSCNPNPCWHGTCRLNGTNNYTCNCYPMYTGRNCSSFRDLCTPSLCQNGGTCRSILGMYYQCVCPEGFTGFHCESERQVCGGKLISENGTLTFPEVNDQNYGNLLSCAWTIETNETKILNITFTRFNVRCKSNWLKIHDGVNTMSPSIGSFCGSDLPNGGTIISSSNVVYLRFESAVSLGSSGFNLTWTSRTPYCGEVLNYVTTHGTIHSPGSPGNYPNSRDCYWPLQTQAGKRFLFHFFTLMIGNNSDCNADYLEFITGTQNSDPVFAKFCNTSHPTPLFSQGSEVLVHFHSDATLNYPGFQITYSVVEGMPGCGGVYTQTNGEIRSPSFNGNYPNNIQCEYKIQLPENSRIKVTFLSFALESSEMCHFDYVAIYAGSTVDALLIGRYCGSTIPLPYITDDNQLLVVLKTDLNNNEGGFVLKYETVCGGKFTDSSGAFNSPGYPLKYGKSLHCIFEIAQPLGTIIKLKIVDFDLETGSLPDCIFDFLEIRDGHDENSTLVGRYCRTFPPLIVSNYNYLYLKFETDHDSEKRGFKANYTTETTGCGGIMKDATGTFSTPNYPEMYLPGTICKWIIAAPPKYIIQLIWTNFHVQKSLNCLYDYVEVFDNNTETGMGTSIGKFCGATPPRLSSTSSLVTVTFFSERSQNLTGFLASYSTIPKSNSCGGNYHSEGGALTSPEFPNRYPANLDCIWTIKAPLGHQILLKVLGFRLEQFSPCSYDWLEIRNGGSSDSPLIGRFCGTTIPKFIPSHTNKIYIYFRSNEDKSEHGFSITWEATATGCGGSLSSPTGSIISPNYPEPYSVNTECTWKITISAGSLIKGAFLDLDLEKDLQCKIDYVEILDGINLNAKSVGRFCSFSRPRFVLSNSITVKFRSNNSWNGRGFHLQYTTICNNTLRGFGGVIESPNFPNLYPNAMNCNWQIEVSAGNKINISFSHFDLERADLKQSDSNKCLNTFVEILYERKNEFQKHGRYCGAELPPLITLNSNRTKIRFVTDGLIHGNGFRLEWQIEGCGEVLTHPNGTIESPNYPRAYPPSVVCNWKIMIDYGQHIEITFPQLELEESANCYFDYIRLYNGEDDTYPEIATICHQNKPVTLRSSGNVMYIEFRADQSMQGLGFRANYTSKSTKCGGKYIADRATIMSPNYPQNYDVNDTCGYEIQITEGHFIALNFEDIDLFEDDNVNCFANNNSYVKVYDGPSVKFPLLAKVCGKNSPYGTILSTTNQMFIEMVTRTDTVAKGFVAKYRQKCGALIETDGSGIIRLDPNYLEYEEINCSWTIISKDPSKHVSLTITHLDLLNHCDPNNDLVKSLRIYNGDSSSSPLLFSSCGPQMPPTLTSDGSALHVFIKSSSAFFATYSVFDSHCGGILTSLMGAFASPGYPRMYPMDTECEWTLAITEGNHVTLSFSDFGLLQSDHCNTDYLEIRQNNGTGKLLGTFCGDEEPTNITNVGSLWIFLKTSSVEGDLSGITSKGFRAEYHLNHDNQLTGPSGRIVSPLYKLGYPLYGEFFWTITVSHGKRIMLTFKDMVLENGEEICFAALYIYDGANEEAPLIKEYCGSYLPDAIKSATNVLFIKFSGYSSSRISARFILDWMEIGQQTFPILKQTPKITCGNPEPIDLHVLMNQTEIQSPGFPNGYDKNLDCQWVLTTIPMNHLVFNLKEVDLSPSHGISCYGDYIEVFEKKLNEDWSTVRKFCRDNETRVVTHTSNMMKIVFKSDTYGNKTGFSAVISDACGGTLTAPSDYIIHNNITRKGSAGRYSISCQWNITVGSGKTIEIKFLEFDIPHDSDKGCNNYLLLRNGKFPDSPILGHGKYCGNELPQVFKTISNNAYIKYFGAFSLANFKLRYREISYLCGGDIILTQFENTTVVTSPNYPLIPPPHVECLWRVRGPPGDIIRIDFLDRFDIKTKGKECPNEFVQIRDGATIYSKLVGTFCGKKPNSQFTTDNMMLVRFFTQLNEPSNGFKARVTFGNCGGTIHDTQGETESPFFNVPSRFPVGVNCTWHLIAPIDYTIEIKFDKIDLQQSENCTLVDHVSIYEPNNFGNGVSSLGTFCGKQVPNPIQSKGNEVLVNFQTSKEKKRFNGFSLKFNASRNVCGGTTEASEGTIQSPGYPAPHTIFQRCSWFIEVPRGRRITFTVEDFDIKNSYDSPLSPDGLIFSNERRFIGFIHRTVNSNKDKKIESMQNHAFVFYWNHGNGGRGFKLRFTSDEPSYCEGDLNEDSGLISQPNAAFPFYCTYLRDKEALGTTFVMILTMTTNATRIKTGCLTYPGSIKIESDEAQGPICVVECVPSTTIIRSPFSHLKVSLIEFLKRHTINYTISFNTYQCGGILTSETGSIKSPGYPNKYSKSMECSWFLKLPAEQRVLLTFEDLNLGDNCEKSYLDVYNGGSPKSPKIDRYCQSNKPSALTSQTNTLWIEYKFDNDSNSKGFSLKYEPKIQGCGGIFHDRTRIIETPSFPDDYPNNAECLWELRSDGGYHIGLVFTTRFQIEESDNCENDYVEIWDWKHDEWVSLGKKCGRELPGAINSTSTRLKVLFRSNDKIIGKGFRAQWEWNCGGQYFADKTERFIVSPNFPGKYPKNMNCLYKITTDSIYEYINLKIYSFDLEGSGSNCKYDNLTIIRRDNFLPASEHIFCGSKIPLNFRLLNEIKLRFQNDKGVQKTGFKLSYQLDNCGKQISSPTMITTPPLGFEGNALYYGYMNCIWNITAPPKKQIVIKFQKFDMIYDSWCQYGSLEIFSGYESLSSSRLVNLCGSLNDHPPVITVENGAALIMLKVDRTVPQEGFTALIDFTDGPAEGCGGNIQIENNMTDTVIRAPDLADMGCVWAVQSPLATTIRVHFDELNLPETCGFNQTHHNCSCASLEIINGHPGFAETIDSFCGISGKNFGRELSSSRNLLGIRLYTRGTTNKAFQVRFKIQPPRCGPVFLNATDEVQTLVSPDYPNQYPSDLICSWVFKGSTKFVVRFIDFDLNEGDHRITNICGEDRLEIMDEKHGNHILEDGYGPLLTLSGNNNRKTNFYRYDTSLVSTHQFCGKSEEPFDYYSNSNAFLIKFSSGNNEKNRGKGFKLQYHTVGCNRNYTSLQGHISEVIPTHHDCYLSVTVPENYTIAVAFLQFIMYRSENCANAGMEIRDGLEKGPVLLRVCKMVLPNPVFSSGNTLWIHLWNIKARFDVEADLVYTASDKGKGCGGVLYDYKGIFTSPLYPMAYKNRTPCEWDVRVPIGMRLALKFTVFDIQDDCEQNYVKVTSYESSEGNEHIFCKNSNPAVLYSSLHLLVKYQSSMDNGGTGWMASFQAVAK